MKKGIIVLLGVLLITSYAYSQELRTRLYTPITKNATYTSDQTDTTIWTPTTRDSVVLSNFILSSNGNVKVTLAASDTIVDVHLQASRPVVSPGEFLWKGAANETIRITTNGITDPGEEFSVMLNGWEED